MYAANAITKLSESDQLPSVDAASWSKRLADRYEFQLSAPLADWFDSEIWRQSGQHEFCDPVAPETLLDDAPEPIWPGLMPCDFLPVIGNASGDWLCLRVDAENRAAEVVQWYHGGGDWLPWGRSIAEAITFDALSQRLPGPPRRHAVPAEETTPPATLGDDRLLQWARQHVPREVGSLLDRSVEGEEVAEVMLAGNVAEIAVRCELVQLALKETLSATLDPATAQQLGVDWNEVVQWMFDVQRMPSATRQRLERDYGLTISKPQDWPLAEKHSRRVINLAPDLAWAWDVIGYAAERGGDGEAAIEAYRQAAGCSVFTDQSVRLRTHWAGEDAAKFSASRLHEGFPDVVRQSTYLQLLCDGDSEQRRQKLTDHWIGLAQESAENGDWTAAHAQSYAAGWDLGADPMSSYGRVLDDVALAAERSGQTARAELARTHRRCLQDRYGL